MHCKEEKVATVEPLYFSLFQSNNSNNMIHKTVKFKWIPGQQQHNSNTHKKTPFFKK